MSRKGSSVNTVTPTVPSVCQSFCFEMTDTAHAVKEACHRSHKEKIPKQESKELEEMFLLLVLCDSF